jgi:hypothetical protein
VQTSGALSDAIRPNSITKNQTAAVFPLLARVQIGCRALCPENSFTDTDCLAPLCASFMDSTLYRSAMKLSSSSRSPPLSKLFSIVVYCESKCCFQINWKLVPAEWHMQEYLTPTSNPELSALSCKIHIHSRWKNKIDHYSQMAQQMGYSDRFILCMVIVYEFLG